LRLPLDRLAADVNAVRRTTERPGLDLTVAQGLRGWLWPWETDPSW
jgi:hypothetical protein